LYLAVDPIIDRLVALKLLRVSNHEELAERFAREARAAGRLLHPNIITIFDVGDHDGQPFIAMEYVTGETLGEIIRRRAQLPLNRRVRMITDLCDGLAFAHRSGIVHRDIKPANIMITREGILKILDFGIAHLADSRMTQTGAFMGTPSYMSPEQIAGRSVDHRSDVFAVGLVLYELLVFRQAFQGDTPIRVTHKILTEDPPSLREIDPALPLALVEIVTRAIEKDPEQRYGDLSMMRADLLRIVERDDSSSETVMIDNRRPAGPQTADRRSLARRRAAQIESHLKSARAALAEGRYEDAINASDQASLLDPDDARAHDITAEARDAMARAQARVWIDQARAEIARGAITAANQLLAQTLQARPGDSEALALQREIRAMLREKELAAERSRLIRRAIEHARSCMSEGALEPAIRSASEVLAQDPTHAEALALKEQALERLEEEHRKADHERRARQAAAAARARFDKGERQPAIADLMRFDPPHTLITEALSELRREASAIEAREREEARRAAEARAAEEAREAARRAAEAKAAEEARQAEKRAAEAKAAEEARQAAKRAAEAKAAEEARQAAKRAADAKAAEEAREAAKRAAEAKAAEEARQAARRAADAKAAEEAREARRRETEAREAEARERERQAAEARAALEETRFAEPARQEQRFEETMVDPRGTWHRDARPAARVTSPVAETPVESPRAAPPRAIPVEVEQEAPRRPITKYIAAAAALAAAVLVIVYLSRPDSTPEPVPTPPTTTGAVDPPPPPPVAMVPRRPVTINAVPWASVRVLGKDSAVVANGVTPLIVELPEGDYTLELRNDLFAPVTQPLAVGGGAPAAVSVTLPGADVEKILNDVLGPAQ
jgi:hypothetical protein